MRVPAVVCALAALLCAHLASCARHDPAVPTNRYALLDLTDGARDVIGLHVTAEALRTGVALVEPGRDGRATLILRIDSSGGFLAEVPALADLIATELPERWSVVVWAGEVASAGALLALASPTLAITRDGAIGGHTPIERLGQADLDLEGAHLDVAMGVGARCAQLGGRDPLLARPLLAPGRVTLADGTTVGSPGRVARFEASDARRIGIADVVATDLDELLTALDLTDARPLDTTAARASLEHHRARIADAIARFDEEVVVATFDGAPPEERVRALDELRAIASRLPRVGLLRGYDDVRFHALARDIGALAPPAP